MSNSLQSHGLQHTRLPCPSLLLEFAQTPVHWVGDAIQLSQPLSPPSPPALSLSNVRIFSNELALRIKWPKYWSFSFSISPSSEYQGWFPLGWTGLISLLSKGFSRVFSSTTVWKHQFFSAQPFYGPTVTSLRFSYRWNTGPRHGTVIVIHPDVGSVLGSLSLAACTRLQGEFIGSSGSNWASPLRGLLCSPGSLCSYRGRLRTGAGNKARSQGWQAEFWFPCLDYLIKHDLHRAGKRLCRWNGGFQSADFERLSWISWRALM